MLATFIWNTLGGLVFDAGLLLFLDAGGEHPIAELDRHRVHCRLRGAREDVARLDRALANVPVVLRHRHVGDHADDLHLDLGRLERQPVGAGLAAVDGEVRALGLERLGVVGVRRRPEQHQHGRKDGEQHAPQDTAGVGEWTVGDERARHGFLSWRNHRRGGVQRGSAAAEKRV
jgi:hypothetical protein